MNFIVSLGDLLTKPQLKILSPLSTNNHLVDRDLDSLEDSAGNIIRAVEPSGVGRPLLTNSLVKITSLKGELQALKREIVTIADYKERKERASWIKLALFEARVMISSFMKEAKKEPMGLLTMSGIILPCIKIPMFDGNILNWWLF